MCCCISTITMCSHTSVMNGPCMIRCTALMLRIDLSFIHRLQNCAPTVMPLTLIDSHMSNAHQQTPAHSKALIVFQLTCHLRYIEQVFLAVNRPVCQLTTSLYRLHWRHAVSSASCRTCFKSD